MDLNDLCDLENPDDDVIVDAIKKRYECGYFYTCIGDILISINPYKESILNSLEVSHRYKDEPSLTQTNPHVFGTTNNLYHFLNVNKESQCFIVSGESGSGKSEVIHQAVTHFLCLVSTSDRSFKERILQANVILEAFGNARTSLNSNATRFCKYLKFHFDSKLHLSGVSITDYLLELPRVSNQRQGEANFNIFYYMFSGRTEDELSKQLLDTPTQHKYLKYGEFFGDDLLSWSQAYESLIDAFQVVGFTQETVKEIFGILSAILNIGDLKFKCEDETTGVFVDNLEILDKVSILLGVDTSDLELCLTSNLFVKPDDGVSGFKSLSEAEQTRDFMANFMYARLFSWIVSNINTFLNPGEPKKKQSEHVHVGFLDIFGFEDFQKNTLEQLCINTTNEQINLHFIQHVFAREQVDYQEEGLSELQLVEYFDNKNIVNLLLETPHGIFALLEEESKCLQADDQTLVSSFNAHCSELKFYIPSTANASTFSIVHYNKKVTYAADDFILRNNAKLDGCLIECLRGSKGQLTSTLFNSSLTKTGALIIKQGHGTVNCCQGDLRGAYTKRINHRLKKEGKCNTSKACHNTKSKQRTFTARKHKNNSVAVQFRNSLVDLIETILLCQAHFVRCIKPNKVKEADNFDVDFVRAQIKCNGILDSVRIRKDGFPVRLPFKIFVERYRFVKFDMTSPLENTGEICQQILQHCNIDDGYKIGATRVLLRLEHVQKLLSSLDEQTRRIVIAQKMVRGKLARIDFDFLQTSRKQEDRNVGNLLVSISSRSSKMHDNLLILNDYDLKRHQRVKDKEMKKEIEKENFIQKRKLTSATDPELKLRESQQRPAPENSPNRKVPRNKQRTQTEPLIRNFISGPQSAWCMVKCYERQFHIASFQMEEAVICVDGTHTFSDKNRIAFATLPVRADDPKVAKVKSCIGKGVQLHQDERQNLWATRLGKNPIFVRGHTLCPELVKLNGKLTQGVPMKVLDTAAFKDYMREEVEKNGGVTEDLKDRIMSKLKICMSFIKDTHLDEETPCWFEIWLVKVKEHVRRYLDNQQKREKRKSGHLDMRITQTQESVKRIAAMPEMRRAKSGDHLRRPRSNTAGPNPVETTGKPARSSRPPSQIIGEKSIARHRGTTSADTTAQWRVEQKITQEMLQRERSMDMIRREKSMDVRLESRLLMEREYRNSMGKPLVESQHVNRVRGSEKSSPGQSPPQSLARSTGSSMGSRKDNSTTANDSPRIVNGPHTPVSRMPAHSQQNPHEEFRRGGSVAAAREGMSYRQVFGLQSSDYLFNVTPPNYTRHRRFSDSDTESLHNFNFIHKVITQPSTPTHQSTQQLTNAQQTPSQQTEDPKKSKVLQQPKSWMKKVRRKSEDNPKRKVVAQLSNK
ncbi:myosin-IIIb-like [Clytia hemisphaerica]|uniref:Uncharacterized protein n=2 Tax=Clytia hemisphaerica TaxID=252671 RepID=A0A7M5TVH7_9CNID